MGIRFRRSVKILPGVRVNFGKKGSSISIGPRGFKTTFSKKGVRQTIGIPGTGVSYTKFQSYDQLKSSDISENIQDIPYTSQCPYCGHKMRKPWRNCPKCKFDLLSLYTPKEEIAEPGSSSSLQSNSYNPTEQEKKDSLCGCLIIIGVIAFLYYFF